ncbi:MAG: DNA alkylation repair protein [Prevotella sp.]|nr:DNA alkylation repair protein [Prevotella sp.]
MYMDVREKIKEIKQSFRLMMDGATAQSMRQKGADYKLNWGATLPRLRKMADEITEKCRAESEEEAASELYALSSNLWKEDVRECKLLATMLMPAERMLPEVADIWMEQTTQIEIAEQAAFNLYQHLPYAAEKAYQWIASSEVIPQICGYHVLSRLFMRGQEPNERGINEFIDQAISALGSPSLTLRKAAMQAVLRFADMGLVYKRIAASATKRSGYDFV